MHKIFEMELTRTHQLVMIRDPNWRSFLGCFFDSHDYDTTAEEKRRPAVEFLEPVYKTNAQMELAAKGLDNSERVNPNNPLIAIYDAVDQLLLEYEGMKRVPEVKNQWQILLPDVPIPVFKGKLAFARATWLNDGRDYGNVRPYFKLSKYLRNVGFYFED